MSLPRNENQLKYKLTTSEAARFLGVTTRTLQNWETSGKLVPSLTEGGYRRYTLKQLKECLAEKSGYAAQLIKQTAEQQLPEIHTLPFAKHIASALVATVSLTTIAVAGLTGSYAVAPVQTAATIQALTPSGAPNISISQYPNDLTSNVLGISTQSLKSKVIDWFSLILKPINDLASWLTTKLFPEKAALAGIQIINKNEQKVMIGDYLSLSGGTVNGKVTFRDQAVFNKGLRSLGSITVNGNTIIGSDGKIPALSSSYINDLDGSEITNVNAHQLNGVQASSFLRSDEQDHAEGQIVFTAKPGSTNVNAGSVYINPQAASPDYTLFGIAVDGNQKFKVDNEGDVAVTGNVLISGGSLITDATTFNLVNTVATTVNLGGAANSLNLADAAITGTIDIGGVTADGTTTLNLATNGTTNPDTITIGNSHASTTLALTGGDDWNVTGTGILTLSASASQTTALLITDTDYTNALSIADNNIIGTTATIDFTNFDVATTGNITVQSTYGLDTNAAGTLALGDVTATTVNIGSTAATTVNLAAGGALSRSISIGTGTGIDTINIGTGGTLADVIRIGDSLADIAITDANWSITTAGLITTADDIAINGGDLTTTATTFNLVNATATTVNFASAATTLNLADAAITGTIDIGGVTANGATTVNIATEGTSADAITIGNSHASTTLALTGGDDWSLAATGVLTLSASAAQTTALIITDTDYTNALSIGDNIILGTTAAIDFSEFDVSASTGGITINDGGDAGSISIEGTVLDINSLDFVAAGAITSGGSSNLTIDSAGGDITIATGDDLLAAGANSNIGSSGTKFNTIYVDTVSATTLVGTVSGGVTDAADWFINGDNGTADTENMSLAFERGTTTPNALIAWDSTNDEFDINSSINLTGTTSLATTPLLAIATANAQTTGDIADITATYTPTAGGTQSGIDVNLTNSPTTSANTLRGLDMSIADATALANTNYGYYGSVALSGNAAKTGVGVYSTVTSSSTTGDTLIALDLATSATGALAATQTRTIYGIRSQPASTGASANADDTLNLYGSYLNPSATLATAGSDNVYGQYITTTATHAVDAGTINQYGLYIANGTSGTNGTATKYGLYVESPTGADTNYAAIFAGGNVGVGTATPGYKLDIGTSIASDRGINIANTAATGTNYGIYSSVTGSATANIGGYFVATGATTSRGLEVAALTSATSTGLTIGALSGTTANTGVSIGTLSGTGASSTGLTIGAISSTGANQRGILLSTLTGGTTANYQLQVGAITSIDGAANSFLNLGAITGGGATATNVAMDVGNISATGGNDFGIRLGTLTGGTTANYQITTGVLTSATTTTNAQLNLGGVVTTGGTTNYGINVGALSGTGTTNYGINVAASTATGTTNYGVKIGAISGAASGTNYGLYVDTVSGAAANYAAVFAGGNVGIGTATPATLLELSSATSGANMLQITNTDAGAFGPLVTIYHNSASPAASDEVGALSFAAKSSTDTKRTFTNILSRVTDATNASEDAELEFYNMRAGTLTEAMTIDSNGNVGIGTTGPGVANADIFTGTTPRAVSVFHSGTNIGPTIELVNSKDSAGALLGALSFVNDNNAGSGSGTSFVKTIAHIAALQDGSGNNSGGELSFYTKPDGSSLAERVRIDESGNVGIGTTAPGQILHIIGSSPQARIEGTNTRADHIIYRNFTTPAADDIGAYGWTGETSAGTAQGIGQIMGGVQTLGTNSSGYIDFYTATTAGTTTRAMRIDQSQNIGIGTTTPGTKLHVLSATNADGITIENSGDNASLLIKATSTGGKTWRLDSTGGTSGWGQGNLAFYDTADGSPTMTITGGGNVGIGTVSPGQELHIVGDTYTTGTFAWNGYNNANALCANGPSFDSGWCYGSVNSGSEYWMQVKYASNSPVDNNRGFRVFDSRDSTIKMVVTAGGNVGIGTAAPAVMLHVQYGGDGVVARFTDTNGSCDVNPTSTALVCASDRSLKKDIASIGDSLDKILSLRGVSFKWKNQTSDTNRYGFIAQEVENIIPELVATDTNTGIKSVNYLGFGPFLVGAIQEQQAKIDSIAEKTDKITLDENGNLVLPESTKLADPLLSSNSPVTSSTDLSSKLLDLETRLASVEDSQASQSALLTEAVLGASIDASSSAALSQNIDNLTVSQNVTVLGTTSLSDTNIAGKLTVGILSIDDTDGSLNVLGTLTLQNRFSDGVQIDMQGNLVVAETVTAKKYSIDTTDTSTASLGSSTITQGLTSVTIDTTAVTTTSKVFVTATTATGKQSLIVKQKNIGSGFVVSIEQAYSADIKFDWWIVDTN